MVSNMYLTPYGNQMQYRQEKLPEQKPVQISANPDGRHQKQHKQKLGNQADYVMAEGRPCLSQPVENTAQRRGQVQKRAQPGQRRDIAAGQGAGKQPFPHFAAVKKEKPGAENPQVQTAGNRAAGGDVDALLIAGRLGLGHVRQQHDGDGVDDGGGEQDKRVRHSGQHTVHGESLAVGHAVQL